MYLTKQVTIFVNKKFGNGNLINEPTIDFALKKESRNIFGNLPDIIRALLVDHCFEDGNKRTAAFLFISFCEQNRIPVSSERIVKTMKEIAMKSPKGIEKIRSMLKYATRNR